MAIYRKKKFTSHKKVGGPEIGAATRAKKLAGRGPSSPIGSAANNNVNYTTKKFWTCCCAPSNNSKHTNAPNNALSMG